MIDRETANELCRSAGVQSVPQGVDPDEWLADNDVFPSANLRTEITNEDHLRVSQVKADREKINALIDKIKADGFMRVTTLDVTLCWTPIFFGAWGVASNDHSEIASGTYSPSDGIEIDVVAYRHRYGNATVYYVPTRIVNDCTNVWWLQQIQTGYRVTKNSIAAIAWAARHALEMCDKYPECLGGEDAVRFVAINKRGQIEKLAKL